MSLELSFCVAFFALGAAYLLVRTWHWGQLNKEQVQIKLERNGKQFHQPEVKSLKIGEELFKNL